MSATSTESDQDSRRQRNWRGSETGFPQATEMDCEEHGLVDSMALVDPLLKLEEVTHMRIPPGKVQPKDLNTVALMFATAQRVGKPRR